MALMSKMAFDARVGVQSAPEFPEGVELQLRNSTQLSAEEAQAWALKRPVDGQLTAVVDLPQAARLNVSAWFEALHPDVVELRTPAWSEAGMATIGWPEGYAVLQRVLKALAACEVTTHLALHISAPTLDELTVETLDRLTQETDLDVLQIRLRPVLGAAAPRLDKLAIAVTAISQSGHLLTASRLLPTCAIPESVDSDATYASERTAARQTFQAECAECPARDAGRCDGMAADLLEATRAAGAQWAGWSTWAAEREPAVVVAEAAEPADATQPAEAAEPAEAPAEPVAP